MWLFLLSGLPLILLALACSKKSQQKTERSNRPKLRTSSPPKHTLRSTPGDKKSKRMPATSKVTSSGSKETPPASIPIKKGKPKEPAKEEGPTSSDMPFQPRAQPPTDKNGKTERDEERPAGVNLQMASGSEQEAPLADLDRTQKSGRDTVKTASEQSKDKLTEDRPKTAREHSEKPSASGPSSRRDSGGINNFS